MKELKKTLGPLADKVAEDVDSLRDEILKQITVAGQEGNGRVQFLLTTVLGRLDVAEAAICVGVTETFEFIDSKQAESSPSLQ